MVEVHVLGYKEFENTDIWNFCFKYSALVELYYGCEKLFFVTYFQPNLIKYDNDNDEISIKVFLLEVPGQC